LNMTFYLFQLIMLDWDASSEAYFRCRIYQIVKHHQQRPYGNGTSEISRGIIRVTKKGWRWCNLAIWCHGMVDLYFIVIRNPGELVCLGTKYSLRSCCTYQVCLLVRGGRSQVPMILFLASPACMRDSRPGTYVLRNRNASPACHLTEAPKSYA
jgi:hypothetical protein